MGTDLENLSCNQDNFSRLEQDREFWAAQSTPGWGTRGKGGVGSPSSFFVLFLLFPMTTENGRLG
jgi:hypothetical protein